MIRTSEQALSRCDRPLGCLSAEYSNRHSGGREKKGTLKYKSCMSDMVMQVVESNGHIPVLQSGPKSHCRKKYFSLTI